MSVANLKRHRKDPHMSVEQKGYDARVAGEPVEACPYGDKRTHTGGVTGSRGYRTAWCRGWKRADEALKAKPVPPARCGEAYCLCSGGKHIACAEGKAKDDAARAVLMSLR